MATLVERIKRRLIQKVLKDVSVVDVRAALAATSPSEREDLLTAVRKLQRERVGKLIVDAVVRHIVEPRAQQEAEDMLAGGTCDEDLLDRILRT